MMVLVEIGGNELSAVTAGVQAVVLAGIYRTEAGSA